MKFSLQIPTTLIYTKPRKTMSDKIIKWLINLNTYRNLKHFVLNDHKQGFGEFMKDKVEVLKDQIEAETGKRNLFGHKIALEYTIYAHDNRKLSLIHISEPTRPY